MKKIGVIGRQLSADKFEIIFDMLDDGVEAGKIEYFKLDAGSGKIRIHDADGYIFVACAVTDQTKPFVNILINDDEDTIIQKMQELGSKMNKEPVPEPSTKLLSNITIDVNGQEVSLNRQDIGYLKEVMELCKDHGFKIKEVICE